MTITDRRGVLVDATDTPIAGDPNPGLAIKAPCLAATTGNIALSGLQTIDGVTLAEGNRVLVWLQTDATTNGIYNASSGVWTRTIDSDSNDQLASGMQVVVTAGTLNGTKTYKLTTSDPVILGSSALTFQASANNGAPIVLAFSGQSNLVRTLPFSYIPNANAFLWNYSFTDGNVGSAFAPLSTTTVNLASSILSHVADANPGRLVYGIDIAINGQPIGQWLSGYSGFPVVAAPDMFHNITANIAPALAAIGASRIDAFWWWQGEADSVPLNAAYPSAFGALMTRLWAAQIAGVSWFPRETPVFVHGIASYADGFNVNVNANVMNQVLQLVVAIDPDKRRFVYTSSLPGATYWDATDPGHMTALGYFSAGALSASIFNHGAGARSTQIIVDPATGFKSLGSPAVSQAPLNVNLNAVGATLPPTSARVQIVGPDGTSTFAIVDAPGGFAGLSLRSSGGTLGAPAALTSGTLIGAFGVQGHDGAAYSGGNVAGLLVTAQETWNSGAHGTYSELWNSTAGTTTATATFRSYWQTGIIFGGNGTGGGAELVGFNNGSPNWSIGNYSAIFGGAFDDTFTLNSGTGHYRIAGFTAGLLSTSANGTLSVAALGTGVKTALGVNTGSAGAVVLYNGDMGSPTAGTIGTAVAVSGTAINSGTVANARMAAVNLAAGNVNGGVTGLLPNASLANSTISGIALGSNLLTLTFGTHLLAGGASYNGSAAVTITSDATSANTVSTIVARDGSGNFSAGTITASLTGHASLDLALTGGTMSGAIAMGSNAITGLTALAAAGALTFQSNGSTFAGQITAGQQWQMGPNTITPLTGPILTVTRNSATPPATGLPSTNQNLLNLVGIDGASADLVIQSFGSGVASAVRYLGSRGTAALPTATLAPDGMAANFAYGYYTSGGPAYKAGAGFVFTATDSWTSTTTGMRGDLYATPAGATGVALAASWGAGFMVGGTTDPGAGNIVATGKIRPGSFTVATLPSSPSAGDTVFCSNVRVFNGAGVQEGAAAGTGGLVTHNGTTWKIEGTNITAIA